MSGVAPDHEARAKALEVENDVLRERVASLMRELRAEPVVLPQEWRLAPREAKAFGALLARRMVTRETIMAALYGDRTDDEPGIKIVDVTVCSLRRKLKPFGIEIETLRGGGFAASGFRLAPDVRARLAGEVRAAHIDSLRPAG